MTSPSVMSFSIHGGEADPLEPYLRIWTDRGADIGSLYGVVEVVSGPPRDVASIVWQGIEAALRESRRLTLTRYLQHALQRGHEHLAEYAARGWRAGVTLASLHDDDLYMAWAGPSFAYLLTDGELTEPGARSREVLGAGAALGERGELVPHVAHASITENDIFLMAWSGLANLVTESELSALLNTGLDNSSRSLYRIIGAEPDFAILLTGPETSEAESPL